MNSLEGKTAVVTGSSTGIGRAIALRLASAGANVVVSACTSQSDAENVAKEIRASGQEATVELVDLADQKATDDFVERAWSWRAGVDVWVNNAGVDVLTGKLAEDSFETKLQRLWEVDVVGTMRCSRDVGSRMKAVGRGAIINIGWDQADVGMEGDSGEMFGTIKGAVMAFSKSLAKSLAPEVRVNCVAPGWIRTDWGDEASGYWQARAVGESLRARWGTPQDIAAAVHFLASEEADFINGQIVPVNGGFRTAAERPES